jgi:hypothetical protein
MRENFLDNGPLVCFGRLTSGPFLSSPKVYHGGPWTSSYALMLALERYHSRAQTPPSIWYDGATAQEGVG